MEVNLISSFQKGDKIGGDKYGYSTGGWLLLRALEKEGVEISPDAHICIHYTPPHFFKPIKGRVNVLFTMWEAEDLPDDLLFAFKEADVVIVPSRNSRDAIRRAGILTPVYICRHAVDTEFYYYKERSFSEVFRFLWLGAPNIRKGYDLATSAFFNVFHGKQENVELYIKSTRHFGQEGIITHLSKYQTVLDTRNLDREALRGVYWSSHIFLCTSRGEGANLCALEAMSSGIPVIAPSWGGMRDYMKREISFPVKYHKIDIEYGIETKMVEANQDDLERILWFVYNNFSKVLQRGRVASDYVRKNFSFSCMGNRMREILEEL